MFMRLMYAGALALALGGAAAPSALRANDPCFDDCVLICMQHSGSDMATCQFECMLVTCASGQGGECAQAKTA